MTIVTLHPVVIKLEGILCGFLVVDEYLAILHFELVSLVGPDRTLVDGQILQRQVDALTLGRNPNRTVVVARPVQVAVQRIDVPLVIIFVQLNVFCDSTLF